MDIYLSFTSLPIGFIIRPGENGCESVQDEEGRYQTQCAGRVVRKATRKEFLEQLASHPINSTTWDLANRPDAKFYQVQLD